MKFFFTSILIIMALFANSQNEQSPTDWANLNRYAHANASLAPAAPGESRVVFMGNSITEFWSVFDSSFFLNKPYINRGISGQTSPQMLLRFRQDVIGLKPAVVVILAGINDIAGNTGPATTEQIFGNIVSMAELARTNGIRVVICSVLPAFDFPWRPGLNPSDKIVALNTMIKDYCTDNLIVYVDYYSAMADKNRALNKAYTDDGVHPTRAGYKVMDELVEKGIAAALMRP
ncbi:MAG: SGNH/GDSL hydrolase family protein [Bacteroidales bacterium]|nr:SGNH/GDSL hydrolase family protein [Bacteroidales bacterium]